jgi:excisionase family DNA binding protein
MEPRLIDLNHFFETPVEACAVLGVSHATLYRRIAKGELQTIRVLGKQLIVKPEQGTKTND